MADDAGPGTATPATRPSKKPVALAGSLPATGGAAALRAFALALPEAYEDYPWGERVAKVKGKVFVFLGRDGEPGEDYGLSVKLPRSGDMVLSLPFTEPTGYGLGKHGWVSVTVSPREAPPTELLCEWIEESYRAVAPRQLVARLDATTSQRR